MNDEPDVNTMLRRTDRPTFPHQSEAAIGSLPAITVKFPPDLPLAVFAAMATRAGFKLRWIRRGRSVAR